VWPFSADFSTAGLAFLLRSAATTPVGDDPNEKRCVTSRRRRLDAELVRRGLTTSRTEAQRLIADNRVTVGGAPAIKASRLVDPGEALRVAGAGSPYVSRGGHKLEAALDGFGIDVTGSRVIDVGSSTGGFTDCVLQRGAAAVVAVDVGRNQLHERMRADRRVEVYEQTDVRTVDLTAIGGPADLVVADLSFISLRTVARQLVELTALPGDLVVLVKPQFEAGKLEADRGRGVIRDPAVWRRTVADAATALRDAGAAIMGAMVSPLKGGDGNVEFLVHARVGHPDPGSALTVEELSVAVVEEAESR
jgi:23S rRNA (cytidine1920-2'-O)/16S rRNA (cytidine1409-2'-O)-methyltransferase